MSNILKTKKKLNKNQINITNSGLVCLLCNVCGSLVQKPGIMKRKRGEARISSTLVLNVSGQLETCTLPKITSLPPIPPQSTSSKIWNDKYVYLY